MGRNIITGVVLRGWGKYNRRSENSQTTMGPIHTEPLTSDNQIVKPYWLLSVVYNEAKVCYLLNLYIIFYECINFSKLLPARRSRSQFECNNQCRST